MNVQPELLLISIGPVQEFIAQARRTRDLWFGSHVLSELSRHVARELSDNGCELVFPALHTGDPELETCWTPIRPNGSVPLGIANKILAEVPNGNAEKLAEKLRFSVFKFWSDFAADVRDRDDVRALLVKDDDWKRWNEQIETQLEFSAAWSRIGSDYSKAREEVEAALGRRKNLRDFVQWTCQRGGVPKSSLDGGRETVLVKPNERSSRHAQRYRIADNEQLDAVGLVKRAGAKPDQFVPIVNVALGPWLVHAASEAKSKQLLAALVVACKDLGLATVDRKDLPCAGSFMFDAGILFESRWGTVFKEQGLGDPEGARNAACKWGDQHVRPLLEVMPAPAPYVSCLVADGDRMGAAIDAITSAEGHRAFSKQSAKFAADARRIVEQDHMGSLVFAGGDDVLAFVPLATAVPCAEALRIKFRDDMTEACEGLSVTVPTLSVGIGIGHILDGMGHLLALGRKAEKLAKGNSLPDESLARNALAVVVDKRSGGERTWRAQWTEKPTLYDRISEASGLLRDKTLSIRKVHEIERILFTLPNPKAIAADDDAAWTAVLMGEVTRALARVAGDKSLMPNDIGLDFVAIDQAAYESLRAEIQEWVGRLLIARLIADAVSAGNSEDAT